MHKKNQYFIGWILLVFLSIAACENDPVPKTSIRISVKQQGEIYAGIPVIFTFTGYAEKIAIFTGDDPHNYDSIPKHTGFAVEGNEFSYEYESMGNFKVVCIGTNFGHWGEKEDMKTDEMYVSVIDNRTGIEGSNLIVNASKKRYVGSVDGDKIIFKIIKDEDLSSVQCKIKLEAPDGEIFANGNMEEAFVHDTYFDSDFSSNPTITIVAPDGTEKIYTVEFILRE